MTKKYNKRPPTRPLGPDFFDEARKALADAGIEQAQDGVEQAQAAVVHADAVNPKEGLPTQKASSETIAARRKSVRENVNMAAALIAENRTNGEDFSVDSLAEFLEEADVFGVHNFRTEVPSAELQAELNLFLTDYKQTIRRGVLAFAEIPGEWLENNGLVPAAFSTPSNYSGTLLDTLERMGYRMDIKEDGGSSSNYWSWMSIFKALRAVARYKKTEAMVFPTQGEQKPK